jgi:phospholipid-translocating ATPase
MLPVFSLVLDVELSESVVFTFPELYSSLRAGRVMSQKTLFAWLWASIYQVPIQRKKKKKKT